MPKTIESVPESISRADYIAMFQRVGIDPNYTASLTFHPKSIEAVVFERADDGARLLDPHGDGYIKHIVSIPVRDDEELPA